MRHERDAFRRLECAKTLISRQALQTPPSEKTPKKFILLYAYNGTGKTRLSMEFKDFCTPGEERDTLYFNAFTEDLFSWDNDLENVSERYVGILNPPTPPSSTGLKTWRWTKRFAGYLSATPTSTSISTTTAIR